MSSLFGTKTGSVASESGEVNNPMSQEYDTGTLAMSQLLAIDQNAEPNDIYVESP